MPVSDAHQKTVPSGSSPNRTASGGAPLGSIRSSPVLLEAFLVVGFWVVVFVVTVGPQLLDPRRGRPETWDLLHEGLEYLVLEVRDNGPGLEEMGIGEEGVGLSNTGQRLANLYDGEQRLTPIFLKPCGRTNPSGRSSWTMNSWRVSGSRISSLAAMRYACTTDGSSR